jgi:cytochrome subunit of sulfide dehydrogenase
MWRFYVLLILLAVSLGLPSTVLAGSSEARGAALANACVACHGPYGRSQGAIPSIDKLSTETFVKALQAFRTGTRQGTVMNRIAKGLDESDIKAVTTYFATLREP